MLMHSYVHLFCSRSPKRYCWRSSLGGLDSLWVSDEHDCLQFAYRVRNYHSKFRNTQHCPSAWINRNILDQEKLIITTKSPLYLDEFSHLSKWKSTEASHVKTSLALAKLFCLLLSKGELYRNRFQSKSFTVC